MYCEIHGAHSALAEPADEAIRTDELGLRGIRTYLPARTVHDWLFEEQKSVTPQNLKDKVAAFAAGKNLDSLKLTQCISSRATEKEVEMSLAEGRAIGVSSTPSVFINGRRLSGSPKWEQLKAVIDYELEYQKITGNAGDDCGCAAEIEFPVSAP